MKDTKKISRTARMFQLVLDGYSNDAAVTIIRREYGKDVPTNTASIGWCRTQLKAKTAYAKKHNPKNVKVISDREARDSKASKSVAISKLAQQTLSKKPASQPAPAAMAARHK